MILDDMRHQVAGRPLLAGGLGPPLVRGHGPDRSTEAARHQQVPVMDVAHRASVCQRLDLTERAAALRVFGAPYRYDGAPPEGPMLLALTCVSAALERP